ncbi:hypothetical protein B0A52_05892 [Exophiala mesophila]|uniref:20S-pre-rRNA D-site endonuclease NOB1 n=1 Tax=Exophiala mesophila TaxID=212818 RepID=A0A438N3T0_EXOME|nr:hypothetical protein B0A52_05892 [Exophiala mesophila]
MTTEATPVASSEAEKPIHTIILDSSPLLLNTPGISTLLVNSHVLLTTPSVLSEMRGEEARTRIETLYKPFLTVRSPKPESIKVVKEFARKTGDGAVLSATDYEILALAYEVEVERNHGDWRLRSTPGQKRVNGRPPEKINETTTEDNNLVKQVQSPIEGIDEAELADQVDALKLQEATTSNDSEEVTTKDDQAPGPSLSQEESIPDEVIVTETVEEESDSDGGWITPSNIKKKQAKDEDGSDKSRGETKHLQVATMTGDFAMQNVLLQMNLNLLSTKTCKRISQIKQFILRCHACFATSKDMSKQFCARCGKPTLTRVSCTTNDKGEVKLHLKANMQWNNRGNVYSIPKATPGTSNQKWKGPRQGGGQGGWGNDLILAEDQKEYIRAMSTMKRTKEKDLMDQDTLPSILTGNRDHGAGRIRIGGGKNINSRKR